jgi:hypothetical protein
MKEPSCCDDIVVAKEKVNNLEMTIANIKEDLNEVKETLGKNGQKLDDLIETFKSDKEFQKWILGFIIVMCGSFGVYLVNMGFQSTVEIEKIKMQMNYEHASNNTDKDFNVDKTNIR